jgi:hypothetical protein
MLTDKGDHLYYLFTTAWDPPFPIYETLISTYHTMDFHIIAIEGYCFQTVDILSKQGNITNYIIWWDALVRCVNNENKFYLLKEDKVNGALRVVKDQPKLY